MLDGAQAQSAFNGLFPNGGPWITSTKWEDSSAPKAYLNYILFDSNFQLLDFGFDQISINAVQTGVTPVTHDYLSLHLKVQQKGYLYVYLSNENPVQTNVYFDDFKINYHSGIVQESEYYPFGLTFNSYARDSSTPNKYLFNGKEKQDALNVNWVDFGARMYSPEIGRWSVIDPLAEKYQSVSTYSYVANNPSSSYDGDGRKIIYVNGYFSRILNLKGWAPGSAGEDYWNFFDAGFINSSRQFMGAADNELNEFIDGSSYIGFDQSGGDRYELGMKYAKENYDELIKGMAPGESFKFVSHSEGGAYSAGIAAYLISRGHTVESMLYLSPDEADEFKVPVGTFSMQAHFDNDPVSPSMPIDGVNLYIKFSTLYPGKKVSADQAHGSTVTTESVDKILRAAGGVGSGLRDLLSKGRWKITETSIGYTFEKIEEEQTQENNDGSQNTN